MIGIPVAVLLALLPRSAPAQAPAPAGTVLRADFAKSLADPELDWPTPAATAAAAAIDTRSARSDARTWQKIVLTEPFRGKSQDARDVEQTYAAGASAGGFDTVYYHWETERYHLQFRCAQWLMSIMVEPKTTGERPALSAADVEQRTAAVVKEVVRCGSQLLSNASMRLETTAFGYLVRFDQTHEQSEALRQACRVRLGEPGLTFEVADDWLRLLTIRTDGYSFVFDFPKSGLLSTAPAYRVTTTRPGDKAWFTTRIPRFAPATAPSEAKP